MVAKDWAAEATKGIANGFRGGCCKKLFGDYPVDLETAEIIEVSACLSTAIAEPAVKNAKHKAFCLFHRRYLLLARMLVDVCFLPKLSG
jgi:hypothetical protein